MNIEDQKLYDEIGEKISYKREKFLAENEMDIVRPGIEFYNRVLTEYIYGLVMNDRKNVNDEKDRREKEKKKYDVMSEKERRERGTFVLFPSSIISLEDEYLSDDFMDAMTQYQLLKFITDELLLNSLRDKFFDLQNERKKKIGIIEIFSPMVYDKEINEIEERIQCLDTTGFFEKLEIDEEVNGFEIKCGPDPIMTKEIFQKFEKLFRENKFMTYEEFYQEYDETACSDWNKIEPNGDSFGGYWKYPERSQERENAWHLTREKNGKALYDLPYPKEALLLSVVLGCGNRRECVLYSNFICEWVSRKIRQMEEYKTCDDQLNKSIEERLHLKNWHELFDESLDSLYPTIIKSFKCPLENIIYTEDGGIQCSLDVLDSAGTKLSSNPTEM